VSCKIGTTVFCGHGILSREAEFAPFRGMSQNSTLDSDKGTNTAYFGQFHATGPATAKEHKSLTVTGNTYDY